MVLGVHFQPQWSISSHRDSAGLPQDVLWSLSKRQLQPPCTDHTVIAFSFQCGRYTLLEGAPLPCFFVGYLMEKRSAALFGRKPTGAVFHGEIFGGWLRIFSSFFHIPLWVACWHRWTANLTANSWKCLVVCASSSLERSSIWWQQTIWLHEVVGVQRSSPVLHPQSLACGWPREPGQR